MFRFTKRITAHIHKQQRLAKTLNHHSQRSYARQSPQIFSYLSETEGNLHTPYPVATVFGATGYLGKFICAELARIGYQVITPYRFHEESVMPHRTMGDVGQVVGMRYSSRQYESIVDICSRSNIVVCAAGRSNVPFFEVSDTFHQSNVEVPRLIARACADTDVSRFIHISHQGADTESTNVFLRKKAEAEIGVRQEYPDATIFRPNIAVGGFPDYFSNLFGKWCRQSRYPLHKNGEKTFQPIFAPNIADAVVQSLKRPYTLAQTYELAGPHKMTYAQYAAKVSDYCNWHADVENQHQGLRSMLREADILPLPLQQAVYRQDAHYWALMRDDLVVKEGTRNTIQSLGILPSPIEHSMEISLDPWTYSPDIAGSYFADTEASQRHEAIHKKAGRV